MDVTEGLTAEAPQGAERTSYTELSPAIIYSNNGDKPLKIGSHDNAEVYGSF